MNFKKELWNIIVAVCVPIIIFVTINQYKSHTAPDEEQVQTSAVTEQAEAEEENEQETEDDDGILPFGIKLGTGNMIILAAIGAAVGINWLKEQSKRNSHTED